MNVQQRITAIRLNEKILKNPVYANKIGIEITNHMDIITQKEYNILRSESNV